jgi:ribosomal protein S18 acetylase RimI-like enzyme
MTAFTVRADPLQAIGWTTLAAHLGYRSVGAWLTALAEERLAEVDALGYDAAQRARALAALSDEKRREPFQVRVRRACRAERDRLYHLALSTPELRASARGVVYDKAAFARQLYDTPDSAILVAERSARLLGFLHATFEERAAQLVLLAVRPEYRRCGIATRLYHAFKALLPREVVRVGAYVPVDSPALVFFERLGFVHGRQYVWMDRHT